MKYETLLICLVILLFPAIAKATAFINPGQSYNCTSAGETVSCAICQYTNDTCDDCPECGTCSIDRELNPGEFFEKQEGVCDIEIMCEEGLSENTKKIMREYTMNMHLDKHEGDDTKISIETKDPYGTIVDNRFYDMSLNDIMTATYRYNFTCPAEILIDNIDFASCSVYFDQYFKDTEPLAMQLAMGSRECMDKMIECEGNMSAAKSLARDFKDQYEDCRTNLGVAESKFTNMNASTEQLYDKISGTLTAQYEGYVSGYWMGFAILGWFLLVLFVFGNYIYGGTELGGG